MIIANLSIHRTLREESREAGDPDIRRLPMDESRMTRCTKRRWSVTFLVCALALCGCGSIKSKGNSYSYLGRVVETLDETVIEQVSRPNQLPVMIGPVFTVLPGGSNVIVDRENSYRRYKVALEQGEQITLRSRVSNIVAGNCVQVWIYGPGVSPVYWYDPDTSEIEMAQGCRAATPQ
jgi:hypothetical protein